MRYKPLKKKRRHPRLKRLVFLLFQRVLQKTLSHAHDNCVAQFLTTLEHSSKKFTVMRSSYLFFIRHSLGVVYLKGAVLFILFLMQLQVLIRYGPLINNVCLPLIISNVTNDINELAKLRLTSFQKTTISIRFNLLQVSPSLPPFRFAMIFIPSCHVLSSYFCVSLSLVEVTTVSILINFTTQSSITKKNRKKEGKKKLV